MRRASGGQDTGGVGLPQRGADEKPHRVPSEKRPGTDGVAKNRKDLKFLLFLLPQGIVNFASALPCRTTVLPLIVRETRICTA